PARVARGLLLRLDEREQARVVLGARGAAGEVRAHSGYSRLRIAARQLQVDEAAEVLEALLARELGALRAEQCLQAWIRHRRLLTVRIRVAPAARAACAARRRASCSERRASCSSAR